MRRFVFGGALLLSYVWLITLSFNGYTSSKPAQQVLATSTVPSMQFKTQDGLPDSNTLLTHINTVRSANGLEALRPSPELETVAIARAQDMAGNNYYAHANPNTGAMYYDLLGPKETRKGFSCENLDLSQSSQINSYVNDWLASNDHRDCMLSSTITKAGIAITEATFGPSNNMHYLVVTIYQE